MIPSHPGADTFLFILVSNVQELFLLEQSPSLGSDSFHKRYHNYNEITEYLSETVDRYPNGTSLVTIGKTFEDRDILGIKISHPFNPSSHEIILHGAIHAREWIGTASLLYIIDQLTSQQSNLDKFTWIIIPVLNVDGYIYTHEKNRMWFVLLIQGEKQDKRIQGSHSVSELIPTEIGPLIGANREHRQILVLKLIVDLQPFLLLKV